jgi:hypothetical protein
VALTAERGGAPPLGLLQVAETIGGADWQLVRLDFGKALAELIAEVPKKIREPAELAALLHNSGQLPDVQVLAQSWFEDGPDIAVMVARAGGRNRAKLAQHLLQSAIARNRNKWADVTLRTALWMREGGPELNPCWHELALVAKALADGRDMAEIGLMRDIATRTIAALGHADNRQSA